MLKTKAAIAIGVLALSAAPALASNGNGNGNANGHAPDNPGKAHQQQPATPGPNASPGAKAKAYGKYCQGESKKHVAGTPGTPFSKCVTAMAKLANGSASNPTSACRGESKKHVKGEKGTPFSRCVSAAAKMQQDQEQQTS
ncbi:MAG TPA: hypothetical protein VH817_17875 [Thermoleophilaceae bacterium]|jgi:hypothetical protein